MGRQHEDHAAARAWALQSFEKGGSAAWPMWVACDRAGYTAFACTWAYFRWADDRVDAPGRVPRAVRAFVADQEAMLEGRREPLALPERALWLAMGEPRLGSALRCAARLMLAALSFDAHRDASPQDDAWLEAQARRIGEGYAIAVWACTGAGGSPPPAAIALARAATGAHHLRDLEEDLALGYNNIPSEAWRGRDATETLAWIGRRARDLDRVFVEGLSCLNAPPRTRAVLTMLAWRYRMGLRGWAARATARPPTAPAPALRPRMALLAALLAPVGCGPSISPSLDVGEDAMLATLPASSTVVAGGDVAGLEASTWELATRLMDDLDDAWAAQGVAPHAVDRIRVACGEAGCVALAEGRFDERIPLHPRLPSSAVASGIDVDTRGGTVAVRPLDGTRIAFGDREALRRVAEDATSGAGGALDPSTLAGRIPEGDAWVLLRDPEALVSQVVTRASGLDDADAPDFAEELRLIWEDAPQLAREMDSLALSLDASERVVRARAVFATAGDALGAEVLWRAGSPAWADPLGPSSVTRDGPVVEITWPDVAADILGGAR